MQLKDFGGLVNLVPYTIQGPSLAIMNAYVHTFIKEWKHKHAGFKTKHNAQSICVTTVTELVNGILYIKSH